jgi:integration host factor subunit alpha
MTKADLAEKVRDKLGFQRNVSIELVESVLEIMKSTLESGEDIKIACFGSFNVRNKAPRQGRNPQTEVKIMISGRKVLTFKPSQILKDFINS